MSNSIWKTPDQKPDGEDTYIAITTDGLICDFVSPKMCDNSVDRWAYLTDIIAQADKAERLQKAVDKAIWILEESKKVQRPDFKLGFTYCLFPQPHLDIILDEIKQLIKETTNDK